MCEVIIPIAVITKDLFGFIIIIKSLFSSSQNDVLEGVGYSVVSNVSGKVPNGIPVVSDAVETQIGM